jgi:uncharacterized protein GlcG (DUF336 family)
MSKLTRADAHAVIDAAFAKAEEMGISVTVAVLDAGRELLAFARMDDAMLASIEVSQGKAYAAISLKKPTHLVAPDSEPGHSLWGLEVTHQRPFITFGGGDVLRIGDEIVGAVGIAGGTPEEDVEILPFAHAALASTVGA